MRKNHLSLRSSRILLLGIIAIIGFAGLSQNNVPNAVPIENTTMDSQTAQMAGGLNGWQEYMAKMAIRYPNGIEIANIDGINRPDLFIKTGDYPGLLWLQSPSDPMNNTSWTNTTIYNGVTYYMEPSDVNIDGNIDLVAVIYSTTYQLVWFMHPGGLGTGIWTMYTIDADMGSFYGEIKIADMNKDGLKDIVTTDSSHKKPAIYKCPADPTGTWADPDTIGMYGAGSSDVEQYVYLSDIDADNDTDILITGLSSSVTEQFCILEAPTSYSTINFNQIVIDNIIVDDIEVANIDKTNLLDIIAIDGSSTQDVANPIYWYTGPPNASSYWARNLISNTKNYTAIKVADINNDSHPDIIAIAKDRTINLILSPVDPYSTWPEPTIIAEQPSISYSSDAMPAIMDVDGDNLLDLIVAANSASGNITWIKQPIAAGDTIVPTISNVYANLPVYAYQNISINANISDPSGIQKAKVCYRIDGGVWSNISMNYATGIQYKANIPGCAAGSNIEFYIEAVDNSTNHNTAINDNSGSYYIFTVSEVTDTIKPTINAIKHEPTAPNSTTHVIIYATIEDASGLADTRIHYATDNSTWYSASMNIYNGSTYMFDLWTYPDGTIIAYYITATDNSSNFNVQTSATFYVSVEDSATAPSVPMDLTAIAGDSQIELYWTIPAYDGGSPIWNYLIYRGTSPGNLVHIVNASTESYIDTGLTNGITYYYAITAINAIDQSPQTPEVSATPTSMNSAPQIITIQHYPLYPSQIDEVYVYVRAQDADGLNSVQIEYYIDETFITGNISMYYNSTTDEYQYNLGSFNAYSIIKYRIFAIDILTNGNISEFYYFNITNTDGNPPNIANIYHFPAAPTSSDYIQVYADITDASAFNAILHVTVNSMTTNYSMQFISGNQYYATILEYFPNGTYVQYYITATDSFNNSIDSAPYGLTIEDVMVDVDEPIITNVLHSPTSPNSSVAITVYADITDASSFTASVRYHNGDYNWITIPLNWLAGDTYTANIGMFATGYVYYYVNVTDSYGNWMDSSIYTITVSNPDLELPIIDNVICSPSNPNSTVAVTITADVYDNNGISFVKIGYTLNGSAWNTENMTFQTGNTYSYTMGMYGNNTVIVYYIEAFDTSNNNNFTENYFVTIVDLAEDHTTPIISDVINNSPIYEYDTWFVNATITDNAALQSQLVWYQINGGTWISNSMYLLSGNIYQAAISGYEAGANISYYIQAIDTSSNNAIYPAIGSYNFTVLPTPDAQGPTIYAILHSPDPVYESDMIEIFANITDISGVQSAKVYYRTNYTGWNIISMSLLFDPCWNVSLGPFGPNTIIHYYINASDYLYNDNMNDNSGMYYEIVVNSLIDSTAPIISDVSHDPIPTTSNDQLIISAMIRDVSGISEAVITYTIDGNGTWTNVTMTNIGGDLFSAEVGNFPANTLFMYYITAFDNSPQYNKVFNQNETMCHPYQITIIEPSDIIAPTIIDVICQPSGTPSPMDNITIHAGVSDDTGILEVQLYYRINGSILLNKPFSEVLGQPGVYYTSLGFNGNGTYIEYFVQAKDSSSNQNIAINNNYGLNYTIYVIDTSNLVPTINQPEDIMYQYGETGACISWVVTHPSVASSSYTLFRNGAYINSGIWQNDQPIQVFLNETTSGTNFYEIRVLDGLGNNVTDVVQVTVFVNEAPLINDIEDFSYNIGENWTSAAAWTITDAHTRNATYEIFIDEISVLNGTWSNDYTIDFDLRHAQKNNQTICEIEGIYEIRIIAYDGFGLNVSDSFNLDVRLEGSWTKPVAFEIFIDPSVSQPIKVNNVEIQWIENIVANAETITFYISTTPYTIDQLQGNSTPNYISIYTISASDLEQISAGQINRYKYTNLANGTYYISMSYSNPKGVAYANQVLQVDIAAEPTKTNQGQSPFANPWAAIDGIPIPMLIPIMLGLVAIILIRSKKSIRKL